LTAPSTVIRWLVNSLMNTDTADPKVILFVLGRDQRLGLLVREAGDRYWTDQWQRNDAPRIDAHFPLEVVDAENLDLYQVLGADPVVLSGRLAGRHGMTRSASGKMVRPIGAGLAGAGDGGTGAFTAPIESL
jgi:hypothetical protein